MIFWGNLSQGFDISRGHSLIQFLSIGKVSIRHFELVWLHQGRVDEWHDMLRDL